MARKIWNIAKHYSDALGWCLSEAIVVFLMFCNISDFSAIFKFCTDQRLFFITFLNFIVLIVFYFNFISIFYQNHFLPFSQNSLLETESLCLICGCFVSLILIFADLFCLMSNFEFESFLGQLVYLPYFVMWYFRKQTISQNCINSL